MAQFASGGSDQIRQGGNPPAAPEGGLPGAGGMVGPPGRVRWRHVVIAAMAAMLLIELINSVRLALNPDVPPRFPQGYVSKGAYSAWAYFRPLDRTSTDFEAPLTGTHNALYKKDDLYAGFRIEGSHGLRYPPTAIVQILPFAVLADPPDLARATQLVDLVGRLCAAATILIAAFFLRPAVRSAGQWVWVVLVLLAFYPLRWMLFCVQAQSFITLFLAVMILAYAGSRTSLAGVMLALAACMKPYLALLLIFAALRRQWRMLLAAALTGGAMILASVALVGLSPWRRYLFDLLPVMAQGYGAQPNQSINGIVHRWLGHTQLVLGPASTAVTLASRLSAVIFTCLAVWPRSAGRARQSHHASPAGSREGLGRAADIGIAVLAVTLASPIAWEHYYSWCIVLFAACAAVRCSRETPAWFTVALACSYVLLGSYWLPLRQPVSGPVTLINSTQFFGAVLLLATAWAAQRRLHRAAKVHMRR